MKTKNMAETTSAWNNTSELHVHRKNSLFHMSFYWGHKSEILFSGWPGCSSGMYALALIFVFVLAMVVEWLSYCSIIKPGANNVAAGFFQTAMHTARAGLSYMVMLAVMSFNGGVFLAAIFGHVIGFLVFGTKAFRKSERVPDLPPRK
ncbi:Copper transporter 4 [Hibiscus syriacus]|uniref:Copper transport protein n=1 Tax=Hibiscus syriacus TaxID=106335 RepID=A0A6A3AKX2_HIBSY|nr:copper transporter 4-like [Hibiscus syriacus]KAE8704523.1 Copper transporter 4 [Hibiscus syriacus]